MNREDQEIAEMIATLRQTEPDDRHGVSIERAMKTGRRKVYTRRSVGVLTAMAAVVAVSVASTAISNQFTSNPQPAATPTGPEGRVIEKPTPMTPHPPWRDPAKSFRLKPFDSWRQEFDVGSAGGFTPDRYETGNQRQVITLRPENPDGPLKGATATITLYPVGRPYDMMTPLPAPPEPQHAPRLPGGKVHQHHIGPPNLLIAWNWTAGAWGFVRITGGAEATAAFDKAMHIAESVQRRAASEVRVPFTVDQRSFPSAPQLRSQGMVVSTSPAGGRRTMLLRLAAQRPFEQDDLWYTVGVEPTRPRGTPNTTIGGKPAVESDTSVVIPNIGSGYDAVCWGKKPVPDHPTLECRAMLATLRLVDKPLDQQNWVTRPVR